MTGGRRILTAVAATAVALALAACSGLPVGGSVNAGRPAVADQESIDVGFLPLSPQEGMTPQQIVQGFLDAGTSPEDNWAIARQYLAPELGERWQPQAGVTIDGDAPREYDELAPDAIDVTVTPTADVDETGAYAVSDAGATALPFRLTQREDGEWRIAEAPDGIVLERAFFVSVFRPYPVMYFDPAWDFLVPDVRWYPFRANPATRIALALVNESPSPWLADSVESGFPEDVTLARFSVTVDVDRVANVELGESARGLDITTLNRMQTQLEASLATVGVQSVEMSVDGAALGAAGVLTRSTRVGTGALVLTEGGFGFLAGDELTPIPGLSSALLDYAQTTAPLAIEVSPSGDAAAVRVDDDAVARVRADGEVLEVDTRSGVIDPTIDPHGFIWTVPEASPSAVLVTNAQGAPPTPIAGAWPDASEIGALRVSRDGTRVAAVVTIGGQHWAVVAGIVRDGDRVPQSLGEAQRLALLPGPGIAVGWLDDQRIGVVADDGDSALIVDQLVGGEGSRIDGPGGGVTSLAGSNQPAAVRLLDAEGDLFVRRGTNWSQVASGILVLATQQGDPL